MIYFKEVGSDGNPSKNIAFQFFDRELPDAIPFPNKVKLNKIEYPGGHKTNQIIGVYDGEVNWTGTFYGTYNIGGSYKIAKDRMDAVKQFMGRPIYVGFPVPGEAGTIGLYVIEEFTPKIRNYLSIDYIIKLVPHQRQEKIKPTEKEVVRVHPSTINILNSSKKITKLAGTSRRLSDALKHAARGASVAAATSSGGPPPIISTDQMTSIFGKNLIIGNPATIILIDPNTGVPYDPDQQASHFTESPNTPWMQ